MHACAAGVSACQLDSLAHARHGITILFTMKTQANVRDKPASRLVESGSGVRVGVLVLRVCVLSAAAVGMVLQYGFRTQLVEPWILHSLQALVLAVYIGDIWIGRRFGRLPLEDAQPDWVDLLVHVLAGIGIAIHFYTHLYTHFHGPSVASDITGSIATGVAGAGGESAGISAGWHLFEMAVVVLLTMELWRLNVGLSRRFYRPGVLLPTSFLGMIIVGTLLIKVPMAVPDGQDLSWLDALFTITSAVCVTGLTVRDTATQFSPVGQAIIGVFIQLGGLGIIIFGSMLAVILGNRLSLRENLSLSAMLQDLPLRRVHAYVRFIVLATLGFELLGAWAMMGLWDERLAVDQRFAVSLFHSVSSFCNAGFSLQSDSLQAYRYSPYVHGVLVPLFVIGGVGFPVLENLWQAIRWRWVLMWRRRFATRRRGAVRLSLMRLTLHSKLVLTTTAGLYLFGTLVIAAGQCRVYFDDYFQQGVTANRASVKPLSVRQVGATFADASFLSLSARTAGFNTMPMEQVSPAGRVGLMMLMLVGASPGGTGGGMKTTTLALLLLGIAATARRREHVEAFSRHIDDALIRKAATLAVCMMALIGCATLILSISEPYPFVKILFEAVSAASTTGLSLGITPDLTLLGKITIIVTMFLGRVGPLAVLGAILFGTRPNHPYAYPRESVVMG